MARTNTIVSISSRNKAWNGTQGNATSNNYAAFIEENVNAESIHSMYGSSVEFIERVRGMGYIFEDVNLHNSFITYNNNNYEILKYSKLLDYRGNIHHVEFIFG